MNSLPCELHSEILSYLSVDELINARCVSFEWKEIIKYCHPIIEKFGFNDWDKYIKTVCVQPGIISKYYEKIPFSLLKRVPKWCAKKGNLDDLYFCDRIVSVRYVFDNTGFHKYPIKIKNYLRRRYSINPIHPLKHIMEMSLEGNPPLVNRESINSRRSPIQQSVKMIVTSAKKAKKLIESDNEKMPIPLWKEYVDNFINILRDKDYKCIGHKKIECFVNTGNIEVARYIAKITEGMKFNKITIEIPNEEIVYLFKGRIKTKSVINMMDHGRNDLAMLIIELDPNCFPGIIGWYLKNQLNDQARGEILSFTAYTDEIDIKMVKYITRYGDLPTLLFFYQSRNIPFPPIKSKANSLYLLDIDTRRRRDVRSGKNVFEKTNFSTDDITHFYQMGGIICLTKDYNLSRHENNLEILLRNPQCINHLTDHLDLLNHVHIEEEHLRLLHWKYYRIEFINWLINKFGQPTIDKYMRHSNFDFVKNLISHGQFAIASKAIQSGFSKTFEIPCEVTISCHVCDDRSISQIKTEINELLIHLPCDKILSLIDQDTIKSHRDHYCWISFMDRYFD